MSNQPGKVEKYDVITAAEIAAGEVLRPGALRKVNFPNGFPPSEIVSYEDVVVIDAGGNGDYDSVNAAMAAEGSNKKYLLYGDFVEDVSPIADVEIVGMPFAEITGDFAVADVEGVILRNLTLVQPDNLEVGLTVSSIAAAVGLTIDNCRIERPGGVVSTVKVVNNFSTADLIFKNSSYILNSTFGAYALELTGTVAGGITLTIEPGAYFESGAEVCVLIGDDGAAASVLDAVSSFIQGARLSGSDAIASSVALTVPCYLSTLIGGVNANVTLPAGSNNVTI